MNRSEFLDGDGGQFLHSSESRSFLVHSGTFPYLFPVFVITRDKEKWLPGNVTAYNSS
jgi:hypothetical protein